jgi:hypothetical protein
MNAPSARLSVGVKSAGTAYLLWLFFGGLGAHKLYLGRPWVAGLYVCMYVLFWFGSAGLVDVWAEFTRSSLGVGMHRADPSALGLPMSTDALGLKGLVSICMIAPLMLACSYDLFTMSDQVRAANERRSAAATNDQDGSLLDSEKLAQIDRTIARYKARQAMPSGKVAAPSGRVAAAAASPPTFGKRR